MVAYGFRPEFVELVRSGKKTQTIRKPRTGGSRHARPGEPIQLFENWRTPEVRKIIDDPMCVSVDRVKIWCDELGLRSFSHFYEYGCHTMWEEGVHGEAQADGFPDVESLFKFFEDTHGLPFEGVLIKWAVPSQTQGER